MQGDQSPGYAEGNHKNIFILGPRRRRPLEVSEDKAPPHHYSLPYDGLRIASDKVLEAFCGVTVGWAFTITFFNLL